ncbi:M3 family oligoendopeptidase [Campylobacter curvus]|uniref:M3 family oligoendopeptidase n=1 Tax=Campylobacter curvus TaxID=200 RepID=UPI0003663848|nr:M3 family oligoendopeptidase [Campylobacter curvus]QKF61523.1 oligoendopeptidase F [Campylobacter curvus]UEB49827.1 M3 family oligoendopeptidase [Campylobacter curvus]
MTTWDLTALFKNEKELEKTALELQTKCQNFKNSYEKNFLNLKTDEFLKAFDIYESLLLQISKVSTYAFLVFAKDTSKGAFYAKFEDICTKAQENLLFFEIMFNEFDDAKQQNIIKASKTHGYYLSNVAKAKAHQLSVKEEQILLRTANTGSDGFARLFDETMSAMKFKFKGEWLGEEEILSKLHDKDRNVRKLAAKSLSDILAKNQHLLGYIYNMIKTSLKTSCELRNFKLPEEPRHLENQTSKKSVDALIKATEANFDLVSKFYDKKRKILGLKKLYDYDRYAPLEGESEYKFQKCKNIVLKAFKDFSPEFGTIAQRAFDEGWIDVYPTPNKRGGAFSHSGSPDAHPYVLLNHTDGRRDLFTLAHELGHAIHQNLSYGVGFLNAETPLTTAETASVFCEMLVFDYVKNTLKGKEKISLLAGKIEDIFATLYRQINFTTFERRIHAYEGEISLDEINKIWQQESAKMFGDSVVLNDYYKIWWSYIPHFIHTPFYCYAYSYAQLLVLAIFGLFKSGKCENFVQIYTEFLSLGGSRSPKELVAKFGFDIEDAKFWQIGINEVKKLVDEFEGLK